MEQFYKDSLEVVVNALVDIIIMLKDENLLYDDIRLEYLYRLEEIASRLNNSTQQNYK